MLDNQKNMQFVEQFWEEEILESLKEYIAIPNKSPMFDPEWEANGHMTNAVNHVVNWIELQAVPGLKIEVRQLPSRTPTIYLELPGQIDSTVLMYGHLDKQPEFNGWHDGLGPWIPVQKDDKLYGRGGADDGYAVYSTITVMKSLMDQHLPYPRIVAIIECSEESGSPDLPYYMEQLSSDMGEPSLVIALDSMCGNYEQLWLTTSLRGMIIGELKVEVLEQGAHSGGAGGIVASSFRLMRQLMSRLEDENTGAILPSFLNEQIPDIRRREAAAAGQVLEDEFPVMYTFAGNSKPVSEDATELVLNNTWLPSLEVTGIDGIPSPEAAGNVLRPYTTAKLALRLAPSTDARAASEQLQQLLQDNSPNGAKVTFSLDTPNPGWHAPLTAPALEQSLQQASTAYFGKPAIAMGCGGSIPFMEFLATSLPKAQFVVTGVLGPHSNAHGPNEFLHIPTAKKITAAMVNIVYDWGQADPDDQDSPIA